MPTPKSLLVASWLERHAAPDQSARPGKPLSAPSDEEIAERIGLRTEPGSPFYDLVSVGGGPNQARRLPHRGEGQT